MKWPATDMSRSNKHYFEKLLDTCRTSFFLLSWNNCCSAEFSKNIAKTSEWSWAWIHHQRCVCVGGGVLFTICESPSWGRGLRGGVITPVWKKEIGRCLYGKLCHIWAQFNFKNVVSICINLCNFVIIHSFTFHRFWKMGGSSGSRGGFSGLSPPFFGPTIF